MMQGTNVLFGQIAVVFGIVIAGVWSATQWTAAALGYQLRLGSPWFDFFRTPVYHPWRLFEWWFVFDAYAPRVFDTGGAIAGGSGLLAVVVAIGMSIWRSRQSRLVTTYGSARWANADDIRKAGLTQPTGVFLGQHDHQYLRHEGPEHILTFAPTRSGKGVGLVVPTLLSWPASAVIHDIKGENWQITAGWRSRFSHCLLFNPTDSQSAAYNPLLEVRRGVHEVRDVQNIADILVDPEGALEKRNHWEKTSHALLVGAMDLAGPGRRHHIGDGRELDGGAAARIDDQPAQIVHRVAVGFLRAHQHVDLAVAEAVARCHVALDLVHHHVGDLARGEAERGGTVLVEADLDFRKALLHGRLHVGVVRICAEHPGEPVAGLADGLQIRALHFDLQWRRQAEQLGSAEVHLHAREILHRLAQRFGERDFRIVAFHHH